METTFPDGTKLVYMSHLSMILQDWDVGPYLHCDLRKGLTRLFDLLLDDKTYIPFSADTLRAEEVAHKMHRGRLPPEDLDIVPAERLRCIEGVNRGSLDSIDRVSTVGREPQ